MTTNPFLDPGATRALYRDSARLATRTSALHQAKIRGRDAAQVIATLIAERVPGRPRVVLDLGCGRGASTLALAHTIAPHRLVGVDASATLLAAARTRLARAGHADAAAWLCADFHQLPLPGAAADVAVASFCLYHAPRPEHAIAEIARILRPGALAVLATKSADSYRELDHLVERAGLDRAATRRPSLYHSAHSGNLPALAARVLAVEHVEDEQHVFTFTNLAHTAEYLATSPKYQLPTALIGNPRALAVALRAVVPDAPVTTTSTVTFIVARRAEGTP